ncbi:MAG: hypothetical protein EXR69_16400 [Myxococcales bacterium]|nr:hypothetical protein [Myxococcales bacterium]
MLSSQADLTVAGQDRETSVAFYAAETAASFGRDWLLNPPPPLAAPAPNVATSWSAMLLAMQASNAPQLCVYPGPAGAFRPGTALKAAQVPVTFNTGLVPGTFNYCFHNNAADPEWRNGVAGNTTDGDGIIAIEAYGSGPSGQTSRITIEVQAAGVVATQQGGYFFAGDNHGVGEGGVAPGGALVTF